MNHLIRFALLLAVADLVTSQAVTCGVGFRQVLGESRCEDVDECATKNGGCDEHALCFNLQGSFTCGQCPKDNYRGNGKDGCIDIDECTEKTAVCDPLTECTNLIGGYKCTECPNGFEGTGKTKCENIDECARGIHKCDQNAICEDTIGNYMCKCKPGFRGGGEGGAACLDVNECIEGLDNDEGDADKNGEYPCNGELTVCVNTQGSYACQQVTCPAGYEPIFDNEKQRTWCSDIDECSNATSRHDIVRSDGRVGVGSKLPDDWKDVKQNSANELGQVIVGPRVRDDNSIASKNPACSPPATCVNFEGGYECGKCPRGFTGDPATGCQDINECAANNGDCHPTNDCQNTLGTYQCIPCPQGLVGAFFSGRPVGSGCYDVDECAQGLDDCNQMVQCINIDGGYNCTECPEGFSGSGRGPNGCTQCPPGQFMNAMFVCTDINECALGTHNCTGGTDRDAEYCTNTAPWFFCTSCEPGFQMVRADPDVPGDKDRCVDIDECADVNLNDCHRLSSCINTPGSYECGKCAKGYRGPPGGKEGYGKLDGCVDIDECFEGTHDCTDDCINNPGSFTCGILQCPEGFVKNAARTGCEDINECNDGNNGGCDLLTNCTNLKPGYECTACPAGYTGTGFSGCEDIDECKLGNGGCDPAPCLNTVGSYICGACPKGYVLDDRGIVCVDLDECATQKHNCLSYVGNIFDGVWKVQPCVNTIGSFECGKCPQGFFGDGTVDGTGCKDIDECKMCIAGSGIHGCDGFEPCSEGVPCVNCEGGYSCGGADQGQCGIKLPEDCQRGYRYDMVSQGCVDVDECAVSNPCAAPSVCTNYEGGFTCSSCPAGFSGTGLTGCTDIDECAENQCDPRTTCTNFEGGFQCSTCPEGFEGDGKMPIGCRPDKEQRCKDTTVLTVSCDRTPLGSSAAPPPLTCSVDSGMKEVTRYQWSAADSASLEIAEDALKREQLVLPAGMSPGTWQFRLQVEDECGGTAEDVLTVTINMDTMAPLPAGQSRPPAESAAPIDLRTGSTSAPIIGASHSVAASCTLTSLMALLLCALLR